MLSEEVFDTSLRREHPAQAKGRSVRGGRLIGNTVWTQSQVSVTTSKGVELEV